MGAVEKITQLLKRYPAGAGLYVVHELKSDGGLRPIVKPNKALNSWLKQMNTVLREQFNNWPPMMHGGIKKRSYVTFAKPHSAKNVVITIDIRECFDSITAREVSAVLARRLKLPESTCRELVSRLCYKGSIPQGFATSNYLSNLYLLSALNAIERELSCRGVVVTNYVDDIALSSQKVDPAKAINIATLELSRAGLAVKKAKTRVMYSHQRQVVCGLVVNKKITVSRELKKRLFSEVANKGMSHASLQGWLSNLSVTDPGFRDKLNEYAAKKGLLKT